MDADLLKWLIVALIIPSFIAVGKWCSKAWEQERARGERAHEALIATLNTVITNCRDERAEALAQSAEGRNRFADVLDGSMREHNETSKEIVRMLVELKQSLSGR